MQNAETVLSVLCERGKRGLPLERLYRQMFNPQLYLLAYGRLYSNHGAMTPGADGETVDGMSPAKIKRIIDALRHERYRFKPVKRTHIPKKKGGPRPLGLPSWSDKLVGEVIRLLLEAYYEPQFSDRSHGFHPRRGCHTALDEVSSRWRGTTWFIEGDIARCFDTLDHSILLKILGDRIHDGRFLRLIKQMLKAGYLEDWKWNATLSGTPQGGVVSPILSNIYLHQLDRFVETVLIPKYTRGQSRKINPEYNKVQCAIYAARKRGDCTKVRELRKRRRALPVGDPQDPSFRRLRYVRYADDHLLGFTGPKAEAEQIKQDLAVFLRDELKLELSQEKTLITHARTRAARFLGYEITAQHNNNYVIGDNRHANGVIALRVPRSVIKEKCALYMMRGKPERCPQMLIEDDFTIIETYGSRYRGIVQYYLLAYDVWRLNRLRWVMETSMLKTLAAKHRTTVTKMAAKHQATIERNGKKALVARFGGLPLKRHKRAVLNDHPTIPVIIRKKELIARLHAGRCELCQQHGEVEVHHVRRLASLNRPGRPQPQWVQIMLRKRRKSLVVCPPCHDTIHKRQTKTATQ